VMRVSLVGMAGSGKSYWSLKLAEQGFRHLCCDELIAAKLAPELKRPDGPPMKTGEWMGFPYEPHYRERESKYLAYETQVLTEILAYLERPEGHPEESVVVDTTGSVIYVGQEHLRRLGRHTTIVYLSTPAELQGRLLQAYVTNPHPMVWRELFSKRPDETNEQALARCYIRLVSARERLYERYAHVTIDHYTRSAEGFRVSEFLSATTVREV
jgi:shikimate kinase